MNGENNNQSLKSCVFDLIMQILERVTVVKRCEMRFLTD